MGYIYIYSTYIFVCVFISHIYTSMYTYIFHFDYFLIICKYMCVIYYNIHTYIKYNQSETQVLPVALLSC